MNILVPIQAKRVFVLYTTSSAQEEGQGDTWEEHDARTHSPCSLLWPIRPTTKDQLRRFPQIRIQLDGNGASSGTREEGGKVEVG